MLSWSCASAPQTIEHARLLKDKGHSLAVIATKTGIPKTSPHRYLAAGTPSSGA
jgi:hypothetical protein